MKTEDSEALEMTGHCAEPLLLKLFGGLVMRCDWGSPAVTAWQCCQAARRGRHRAPALVSGGMLCGSGRRPPPSSVRALPSVPKRARGHRAALALSSSTPSTCTRGSAW